jgi:hypothetical protein
MSPKPRLTVLMPTLNAQRYIGEALASIVHGALPSGDLEVLVLDGNSTDDTVAIARGFGSAVRVSAQADVSLYEALNRGLREARADLIGWLNADDRYEPNGPAALLESFTPAIDIAYGNYLKWNNATNACTLERQYEDALERYRSGSAATGWVSPVSAIWRRDALRALGGWDQRYKIVGDRDLWVRAAFQSPPLRTKHVDQPIFRFRFHSGSLTTGNRHSARILLETLELTEVAAQQPNPPEAFLRAFQQLRRDHLHWAVWAAVLRGRLAEARHLLRRYGDPGDTISATVARRVLDAARRRIHSNGR